MKPIQRRIEKGPVRAPQHRTLSAVRQVDQQRDTDTAHRGHSGMTPDHARLARFARIIGSMREYYTTGEVAELLGLSRSTVGRLVDRGRIPAQRVGSHRRIFKEDLEAADLLQSRDRGPRAGGRAPRRRDVLRLASRIKELAGSRHASNVRLFGSVAQGRADVLSDVDFLVDLGPKATLLDLAGLELDLEALLGRRVDVGDAASLRSDFRARVLSESIPL
jgi:excisionase family DNA binding protein